MWDHYSFLCNRFDISGQSNINLSKNRAFWKIIVKYSTTLLTKCSNCRWSYCYNPNHLSEKYISFSWGTLNTSIIFVDRWFFLVQGMSTAFSKRLKVSDAMIFFLLNHLEFCLVHSLFNYISFPSAWPIRLSKMTFALFVWKAFRYMRWEARTVEEKLFTG